MKGTGLQFDGVGDYLDYGKSPALNFKVGAPFTFAGWVRTTRNNGPIVSQRNSKDGGADIDISVSDGGLHATVREGGGELGQPAAIHGGAVNDGTWRHFALTRDAAAIELFLDGASQGKASGAQAGGAITTDMRALGSERYWAKEGFMPQDQRFFQGAVDEFCVFGRALSAAEIRELAGPPRAAPKPPAVAVGPAAPPPDGPPGPPPPKADMEKLQLTLPEGWKAEYQRFSQTWELEKYTPAAGGLRESSNVAIDRLPDDAPATPDAYAEKLKVKDFQGIGYAWSEITEKKALPDGFLITGQVRDYEDKTAPPRLGLVMVRTIDGVKVRCSSGRLRSQALREEAMQILKTAGFAGKD